MELKTIRLDLIDPHPDNPREELTDIPELAASIAELGILQPPAVSSTGGERYIAEFGHRRIAAAKHAGLTEIQVYVKDDDSETAYLALVAENEQQRPLTPAERAKGQQGLLPLGDIERAARATGVPVEKLKAAQRGRELVDKGKLAQATLDELATLDEFSGTEQFTTVENYVGTPNFAYYAGIARRRIEDQAKSEQELAEIVALGATICPAANRSTHFEVGDLTSEAVKVITPAIAAEAGVLQYTVSPNGDVRTWVLRADAEANGWYYRYGSHETTEQREERERRAAAREAEMVLHDASQSVRRTFLAEVVRLCIPKLMADYIAEIIANTGYAYEADLTKENADAILGEDATADKDSTLYIWAALVGMADEDAFQGNAQLPDWDPDEDEAAPFLGWMDALIAAGYSPTPWETVKIANARAAFDVCEDCAKPLAECTCDKTGGDDDTSVETAEESEGAHEGEIDTLSMDAEEFADAILERGDICPDCKGDGRPLCKDGFSHNGNAGPCKTCGGSGVAKVGEVISLADVTSGGDCTEDCDKCPAEVPTASCTGDPHHPLNEDGTCCRWNGSECTYWAGEAYRANCEATAQLRRDRGEDVGGVPATTTPVDLIPGAEDLTPIEALTAESNPFADVRISKDLAKMDADRMIEELDNGKVISLMHWDGDVVYQVSTHSELGNPDAPKVAYIAAHLRRPIGAAIADARIFADRYAKAHGLDTAGLTVEGGTITLKFAAKGGEAS